ncbi:MAG: TaqI-like C-terminal specificity domain-containing protein [Microcoleus anatoxicus]|uniref:Eco57I restriction-modification methylase domain-containing protein n=1 Tax=Microcoleus anatoxicus TaxID=2705319 RepID=UPI00366FF2AF
MKDKIAKSIQNLAAGDAAQKLELLFQTLGYTTQRKFELDSNHPEDFIDTFGFGEINQQRASLSQWKSVDFLFQLTEDEIKSNGQLGFSSNIDQNYLQSYIFLAVELRENDYTRSQLSDITREVNRQSDIPIMVLFRHGECFTLSIINRRPNKRATSKDVLEKITLIKDINISYPHRAHIEILFDLSLPQLFKQYQFTNFDQLHDAWQKTLDTSELNKRFFKEVANWYFWAVQNVTFPEGAGGNVEIRNATSVIRLITRLIFVWFLKEKGLVPDDLFNYQSIQELIKSNAPEESTYYKAILQNLFFATLNQEMNTPNKPDNRKFRNKAKQAGGRDQNYMIHNVYRYEDYFHDSPAILRLFDNIPFLNGGLFECLDKPDGDNPKQIIRIDGFSERQDNRLNIPNCLFFSESDRQIDLNDVYGTKNKRYTVRGLINIFHSYKFTVTENTPIEEEIALDPELLGKVFENLLAAYNPETNTTARKQTGSFYTPREIVDYMVDEALIACLEGKLSDPSLTLPSKEREIEETPPFLRQGCSFDLGAIRPLLPVVAPISETHTKSWTRRAGTHHPPPLQNDDLPENETPPFLRGAGGDRLRHLLAYNDQPHQFTDTEVSGLIEAIDNLKILDPACGSGAFPMGILHKLVYILSKLDPQNGRWKEKQISKASEIPDGTIREKVIEDIEQAFEHNELDYGRKLYLIENCIYGVDIQPVAIQISKLRFFISLIVHQNIDNSQENRGVRPLPNLETKFVAANALIGIKGAADFTLRDPRIEQKEKELAEVRRSYFMARTPKTKAKYRELDDRVRHQISEILKSGGFPSESAEKLANWKPYEQNAVADFFDSEWMFGLGDGFDVCIGNPPYVRQEQIKEFKPIFKSQYDCYTGVADLYVYFYEQGLKLLKNQGILCYISSNKYFRSGYGEKLRKFLANESTIQQLIDFGDAPIFTAIAYPSIIIASKEQPKNHQTRVLNWELGQPVDQFAFVFENQSFLMAQKELTADGWRLESSTVLNLLGKLRTTGTPLGEYVNGRFYRGILTGFNEAFVVDRETRDRLIAEHPSSAEVLKPFLRGRDVKRWSVNFAEQYLIKIESSENKQHPWSGKSAKEAEKIFAKTYPAIHARFDELREELSKRSDQGKFFWELRSCKYWHEFEHPKIIYPNICNRNTFAWDDTGFYANQKAFIISGTSKYLLGILNSNIFMWFFDKLLAKLQNGFYEPSSIFMDKLPIPNAQPQEKLAIEILVNYIIYLTAELKDIPSHGEKMVETAEDKLMLSYFEQIVDALVMELYLPEELHSHDKYFMSHVLSENLPAFDTIKGDKMPALRQIFKRLFDSEHPIRVHIYFLNSLEVVRIIRGLG